MKFEEAIILLRAGKKVRQTNWYERDYIYSINGVLHNERGVVVGLKNINTEWVEYEERNE